MDIERFMGEKTLNSHLCLISIPFNYYLIVFSSYS